MFSSMLKINPLWFVYKGWLLPARTRLYNLSWQHPYCLLVLSRSFLVTDKCFYSCYFCSNEQFFNIAFVFQNNADVVVFNQLCKFFGFASKLCQGLLQEKVHRLFNFLHISRKDQTHSLLWLLGFWKERWIHIVKNMLCILVAEKWECYISKTSNMPTTTQPAIEQQQVHI